MIPERSLSPARSFCSEIDRNLSQRHSPIGAETSDDENAAAVNDSENVTMNGDKLSVNGLDVENSFGDNDEWENWDDVGSEQTKIHGVTNFSPIPVDSKDAISVTDGREVASRPLKSSAAAPKQVLDFDDIARLDIKMSVTRNAETSQVDDLFADMTPVISEALKFDPSSSPSKSVAAKLSTDSTLKASKFDVVASSHDNDDDGGDGDGWGGDGWD